MMKKKFLEYQDYVSIFDRYGESDFSSLKYHYPRFCTTQKILYENWSLDRGNQLLDIGAHWLHQSLLYALDGFKVTAADFSGTLSVPSVKRLAEDHHITLFSYDDLSQASVFDKFPENSFDVILFGEIIEHITFNPVDMWKAIYRILSPGGKIVVTTPNYYFWAGRFWDIRRLVNRMGGGDSGA